MASWKQNKVVGIAAGVVVVIVVAIVAFTLFRGERGEVVLKCIESGAVFIKVLPLGTEYPVKGPAGKETAYPAMGHRCIPCGHEFYVVLKEDAPAMIKCPECGSENLEFIE